MFLKEKILLFLLFKLEKFNSKKNDEYDLTVVYTEISMFLL